MSLSTQDRIAQVDRFVVEFVQALRDEHPFHHMFVSPEEDFPWMDRSIWNDLKDMWLIVPAGRREGHYHLTGHGWKRALKLMGEYPSDAFTARCGRLAAALKKQVAGRRDDSVAEVEVVAADAGEQVAWVQNMILSGMLAEVFRGRQMRAHLDWETSEIVTIPANFGQEKLR